jgi:hypothetical protein
MFAAAVVALAVIPSFVEEVAAKRDCQDAVPHGECGIAVAAGHNAGSEGAGKVGMQDLAGLFEFGDNPGKQIGGGE